MKAIIVHGSYGNPEENWFGWLGRALESRGVEVFAPVFPTPEGQSLEAWRAAFQPFEQYMGPETIVIGHSLGPAFVLDVLGRGFQAKAAFFVAGFAEPLGNPEFDTLNKTFVERAFDWELLKKQCPQYTVLSGEDDPYVPPHLGARLAQALGAEFEVVPGAGHFNEAAGYTEFPALLGRIEEVL